MNDRDVLKWWSEWMGGCGRVDRGGYGECD